MSVPAPGSEKAVERGCTCDPIENCYGAGAAIEDDTVWWVFDVKCPLHGTGRWIDPDGAP